jgi:hypothetical protein
MTASFVNLRPFLIKIVNNFLIKSLKHESTIVFCLHKPHTRGRREREREMGGAEKAMEDGVDLT